MVERDTGLQGQPIQTASAGCLPSATGGGGQFVVRLSAALGTWLAEPRACVSPPAGVQPRPRDATRSQLSTLQWEGTVQSHKDQLIKTQKRPTCAPVAS